MGLSQCIWLGIVVVTFATHNVSPLFAVEVDPWQGSSKTEQNAQAVKEVAAGDRELASAAWWGFDAEDSTAILQAAIDSGVKQLVVPNMGKPWIVRPIRLRSNLELVLEEGVEILAKKGEFHSRGATLLRGQSVDQLTIRGLGEGATLRMHKADYAKEPYLKGEWRMGISLVDSTNILIENVTIKSTGGDGIYLGEIKGKKDSYCKNVVIRNVICDDNYRQGMSVIGVDNLLVEDCVFSNTSGTPPAAGVDLEPNASDARLTNVVFRRCISENNHGFGFVVSGWSLWDRQATAKISVRFEDCVVRGGDDVGLSVSFMRSPPATGEVVFENCRVEGTARAGALLEGKEPGAPRVRFINCVFKDVATDTSTDNEMWPTHIAPIAITNVRPKRSKVSGGVSFENCVVIDQQDRPVIAALNRAEGEPSAVDVSGTILADVPGTPRMDFGEHSKNVHVTLKKMEK